MLSLCEAFANIGSLLGLYSDRPTNNLDNTWCCISFLTKILFLIIDFISSSLDWNVAFQLSRGNFQIIGATSNTEEVGDTEVLVLTAIYITMMVISHLVFLRGKWFYLHSGDWAAFSMTEIVIYAVEDVTTIFLFLVTRGFFDPNEFLDRFNVIISNVSGYLVVIVLWFRLFSCQRNDEGRRAPCSAYAFPIFFTVEIALISVVSYRTLFLQKWDSAFEVSGDDVGIFDFLFPIITGSWAGVMFIWLLAFLCKWDRCLNWARQDGGGGGREGEEHSLCGFLTVWTVMFGVTIVCGYFLSLLGNNEYDWIQSYSDIPGEIQEKHNKTAILRFGHTVSWGANGDRNGKGASILIGALDPYNVSAGYSAVAGLCDPPCLASNWTVGTLVLNMPFCTYPSALAGFETNWTTGISQGFVRKSYYKDHYFYGPDILLEETNGTNIENASLYWTAEEHPVVSIAAGGSNVYDLTPGAGETPNPSRVVVGYPYGSNGTKGLIQIFQVYKQSYNTGGFVNTARDVLQIGQDIIYGSGAGEEEESFRFGDQVSMGRSDASRLATTYMRKDESKVILFYDYNKNNDYWDQQAFGLTNKFKNDEFGYSMELNYNGDRVVVGAPGYQKGFTYVYEYQDFSPSSWVQIGEAIAPNMDSEDDQQNDDLQSLLHFGFAVAINEKGDRIAAAGETQDSTMVFIFEQKGSSWVQMGSPILGEPGNFQAGYRYSLSLNDNGKFIAIGGIGEGDSLGLGRVRVFKYSTFI